MKEKSLTTLNERDSLRDMLLFERYSAQKYLSAIDEYPESDFIGEAKKLLCDCVDDGRKIYKLMRERGYAEEDFFQADMGEVFKRYKDILN